jgi:hypothetical protein
MTSPLGPLLFDVQGRASVIWVGWAFALGKSLAALALTAAAAALLTPAGRARFEAPAPAGHDPAADLTALGLLAGAGAAVLVLLKWAQFTALQGTDDAAMLLSVAWNAGRDGFLPNPVYGLASHLQDHFEPVLALFAPLARATGSPLAVMTAHALLVASGFAVFWRLMGALGLERRPKALLAAAFVTNPYLHECLATWFYPAPLAIPLLLAVLCAWEEGRFGAMAAFAAALLLVKEEGAVALAGVAVAAVLLRRPGGWHLLALSGAAFAAVVWAMGNDPGTHTYSKWPMFGWGRGPLEVVAHLVANPLDLPTRWAWPPSRLLPLAALAASTGGFLAFFPPALAALVLVDLPHRLALDHGYGFHTLASHYSAFMLPFVLWGSAHALRALWRRADHRPLLSAACLLSCAVGLWRAPDYVHFSPASAGGLAEAWAAVGTVGREDAVWSSQPFAPALSFRRRLKVLTAFPDPRLEANGAPPDKVLLDAAAFEALGEGGRRALGSYLGGRGCRPARSGRAFVLWECPRGTPSG